MMRIRLIFPLIALLLLAGCGQLASNPVDQPGTWKPIGANDINLRAMIADPADLGGRISPAAAPATLGVEAIDRMKADKVKSIASPEASSIYGAIGGGAGVSQ